MFLDFNPEEAKEPVAVPADTYQVLVASQPEERTSANDNPYVTVRLEIQDPPEGLYPKDIMHMMMLPTENDTAKERNFKMFQIKQFCKAFDIPMGDGVDLSDAVGRVANAVVTKTESPEYGEQNRVKSFITPS